MVRPAMSLKWTCGSQSPCFPFVVLLFGVCRCWCLNAEGLALLHFLAKVESDPSGTFGNWDPKDYTPCTLRGVTCLDGKVHMFGQGLGGVLAPELGNLSYLRVLSSNSGYVHLILDLHCLPPTSHLIYWQTCPLHEYIDLSKNRFSGTIPQEFGRLTALETLYLRDNNLNGKIPEELAELYSLKSMLLGNNRFDGNIPVDIGKQTLHTDLQSDDIPTNRKLGIRQSVLKQLQRSNSFHAATEGIIFHSLRLLHLFKFRDKLSLDRADDSSINLTGYVQNVDNEFNNRRRRLAEESSNLGAIPPNNFPPARPDPALTLPIRSSGSFPAIPKPKAPAPALAPPPTLAATTSLGAISQPSVERSSAARKSENSSTSIVWILLTVFLLITAIVVFIICRSRAAEKLGPWKTGLSGQLQKAFVTGVPRLNREELETASEDFSNIINTIDGAATVYKGTLSSGVEIAVVSTAIHSLKDWSKCSDLIFRKKIDMLSRVNHKNFLNLIGYCKEDDPFTRMMVFEYAPNGTLYEHLHEKDLEHLDWTARMRIVMGTAYCLQHMYELNPPIPHFLLTSKEVFLTEDYASKVGDMSFWGELMDKSKKHLENELELSPPADIETNVQSFGVILLEIISGKLPYTEEQGHITNWAMPHLNDKNNMKKLVDPTLQSCNEEQLEVVCDVIKRCVEGVDRERPSMKEVVQKLTEAIKISPDAATPRLSPLWWAELEILSAEAP